MIAENNINRDRIWRVGGVAIVASVVVNLMVFGVMGLFVDYPAEFPPLTAGAIGFLTTVFTAIAVGVFAFVARRSKRPIRTYHIVAAIAFVLSIVPNIAAAANPAATPIPGATSQAFLLLIVFHVVAYLLTVGHFDNTDEGEVSGI